MFDLYYNQHFKGHFTTNYIFYSPELLYNFGKEIFLISYINCNFYELTIVNGT